MWLTLAVVVLALGLGGIVPIEAQTQGRFLGREEITLYGLGLTVQPVHQTVPKGFATIVSAYLQTPQLPGQVPPFAPDAEVRATLRGPSFTEPRDLVARPNAPFNIPILTVAGTHALENIRLVSGGEVLLYGSPQSVTIEVIEKLLVTSVTARPLTADEIREKGIVFDKSSYQAYNFTAAFAIDDGSRIDITFPVVLPTLVPPANADVSTFGLGTINPPVLKDIATLVPDTLRIQARIPNLSVTGFTLTYTPTATSQDFYVPPIPGVIVIPGDIGFLNQFFSVMLMVANVAPTGSTLVVSELTASIVLPPGIDNVVGSLDDPLRMAHTQSGESPRVAAVTQPGADGVLGTGDDVLTLGPGETGNAEYLVEGLREGAWTVEMEIAGTLNGMPVGPVPIRGRAAGVVLVRNPSFTLTFTHPEVVNAGEPYTLDVTVTNTSSSPANFVSVNLFANQVSGARLDDEPTKPIEFIAPNDSVAVSFRLIAQRTGRVTAATLDSDEKVAGRFALKTGVGEFGIPLSPDSLVLPKEASTLPVALRDAVLGLLGRAWAVATAPPAVFPKDLDRFSKQVVLDRAVETAEAGFRHLLGEPLPRATADLLMDFLGSEYRRLGDRVPPGDQTGLLDALQRDVSGFDLLRRKSVRGDAFAGAIGAVLEPAVAAGPTAFHEALAGQYTARPGHLSILVSGGGAAGLPIEAILVDPAGRTLGGLDGTKVVKEVPFGDVIDVGAGVAPSARLLIVAVPESGEYVVRLARRPGADPGAVYGVSVAYPAADGSLRFASFADLAAVQMPSVDHAADDPVRVRFELAAGTPEPRAASPAAVADPPPALLGAVQMAEADIVGCPQDELSAMRFHAGRVVAVLFSEEVTAESVQDKARPEEITAFRVDGNRVVGVALQPGRRIAYVALREPFGPFVARTLTAEGVSDTRGQSLTSATVDVQATVTGPAGVVSGQVLKADGTPAAFAEIRLLYEFECNNDVVVQGIASEFADANGQYQFDYVLVPPRAVKFVAIDQETDDIRVLRFNVARHSQRLNVNVVFLGRGTLAGRTLAEDGTPLANSNVRVTSLTDQSQYGAVSDAEGRFEIQRVPVGNVVLEAVNTVRNAQVLVSERVPFAGATITRDLVLLDVDMTGVVEKTGAVSGRVLRADGVTPVSQVPVVVYYKNRSQAGLRCPLPPPPFNTGSEPESCAVAMATTAADGAFTFPTITAGELRFHSFDQAGLQEGEVRLTLAADQAASFNLLLGGGFGTVRGRVIDQDGNPVPDAEVGGGLSLSGVGSDGSFELTDVPVGRREIVAVSQAMQSRGESVVDIVREGEIVNTTIVLEAVGGVSGIVTDRAGVPQPNITVYVFQDCYDEHGNDSICVAGEVTTDAAGAYRVNGLKTGKYTVSAFRRDLRDGNLAPFVVRYHRQIVRVDLTFRGAGGQVTGRVLRARPTECLPGDPCVDTPLPARVAISGHQLVVAGGRIAVRFEYVQNFQIVDNDFTTGEFAFSGLWVGPFTVRAAGQFSPEPVAVEGTIPAPGESVHVDLRLQPTSRITGTIYEPDGVTPVTNRQVSLRFSSNAVVVFCHDDAATGETNCVSIPQGIQEAFAATDEHGRFTFPIVNAGAFTITASDTTGGRVAETKGAVKAGETLDLDVRLLASAPVTVRVVRSDGHTLVPGAVVELQQIDYPKAHRAGTAVDGTIIFPGLGEGQFVVSAIDSNGFAGRASGRVVVDGGAVTVNVYLWDATGTVSGLVTRIDETGAAVSVPNAEVVLTNASGPIAFAVTGADGIYTVPLVPLGPFTVEGFDPVTAVRGRAAGQITGAAQPVEANIQLESLGVIRGIVLEAGSLAPLKGWQVTLHQTTPAGRGLPALTTMTSVDGSFSFPGASVGSFSLHASNRFVVGSATATGSVTRPGQLIEVPIVVNIVRRATGTVAGRVMNPDGTPAPNAQVEVCSSEGCRPTPAGADGLFSIGDIPLGRFTVRASAQVTGNPSVGTTGGSLYFEGDTAEITVTLMGLSVVEGTVFEIVNSVRVPAQNATVRLYGQPGSGCAGPCQQGTDPEGRFRFVNVPAKTFTVSASNLAGQQGSIGDVLDPGETKTGLEVVLAPAVGLQGRALLADGRPAAGIVAEFTRGSAKLFAETDASGTFAFQAVTAGAYTLLLQDPIGPGIAKRSGTLVTSGGLVDLGDLTLDETPPAVGETVPAHGAIDVALGAEIRVTFTEPVNPATVTAATVSVSGPAGPVGGELTLIDGDRVARFRLPVGATWRDLTRYTIRVSGVEDRLGKPMASAYAATFTTIDTTPPSIVETTPVASASGVSISSVVRVRYSEIIDPSLFAGPAIVLTGPQGPVAGRLDAILGGTVMVFTPAMPLAEDAAYQVTVAPATDLSGVTQAGGLQFAFTTTDRTPPLVSALVAANGGRVIENSAATVTATIAGGDVAFVDFFLNDTFAFTDYQAPFAVTFQATPAYGTPGANIRVSAAATDTSGNRGPAVTTPVVVDEDVPPSASIDAPIEGLRVTNGQTVAVVVRGIDDVGIAAIGYRVRIGATVVAALTRAVTTPSADRVESFSFVVPAGAAPGVPIVIDGSVSDVKGQVVAPAPVTVSIVDTIGPTAAISSPLSGDVVQPGQPVTVVVTATDPGEVAAVRVTASGAASFSEERAIAPPRSSLATAFGFTVPANAPSNGQIQLSASATDRAGNTASAATVLLRVADGQRPTATIRTQNGSLDMYRGRTVSVIVSAADDAALATLTLSGAGAFTVADSYTVPGANSTASHVFVINVPAIVPDFATVTLTGRAVDQSGNQSFAATLTLTARPIVDVTLPPSVLLRAGDTATIDVTLPVAQAGSVTVQLVSAASGVATVTPSVTFAAGETIRTAEVIGVSGGTARIDALVAGIERASTTVTVRGGIVRGQVLDQFLVPVAGAQVSLFHNGPTITTTTDGAGAYEVEGVVGGSSGTAFTVRATDGENLGELVANLSVPGGFAEVDVIILPLSIVQGTVRLPDGATLAPAGVQVDLYESVSSSVLIGTEWTDDLGAFSFRHVAPGGYRLEASDLAGNRGRATTAVTGAGQQITADITMLGRGTVTGVVRDGAGQVVSYANVQLHASSLFGAAPVRSGAAGADGRFVFDEVFVGSFTVNASDANTMQGGSTAGTIASHGQTVDVVVTLSSYGNLRGTVFRADGVTPAPGASVHVATVGGGFNATTDTEGRFALDFLPFGAFTISVTDGATRARGVASGAFTVSGATVTEDVTLLPQGSLLVTVRSSAGVPVNGASVQARVVNGSLVDTLSGTTGTLNEVDGQLLLTRLMVGAVTVTASHQGLGGTATGTVVADEQTPIAVTLEPPPPAGAIQGTVTEPGGALATGSVRASGPGLPTYTATLSGGAFRFDSVRLGTYRLDAYDAAGRFRATASGVALAADGQVATRDLVFTGIGRVEGFVHNPFGAASSVWVEVRSLDPVFGRALYTTTGAAGEYAVEGVPVGQVRVSAVQSADNLRGENVGLLEGLDPVLTIHVTLENNTFTAVRWVYDANDSSYAMQPSGAVFAGGVRNIFAGGVAWLDLFRDGNRVQFSGTTYGTHEDGGRETVGRQLDVHGLNVTRKFFVPENGYFARVLETLTNPTAADITVDVVVTSNMIPSANQAGDAVLQMTSSGDAVVDLGTGGDGDHWLVMDDHGADADPYYATRSGVPVAFVFEGAGAARPASTVRVPGDRNQVEYRWDGVTIPAGGTVTLMHFVAQQVHRHGAIESATRLVQLPPEALAGLDPIEIGSIVNFAVPADGISGIDPLPAIDGQVSGAVFEGDGSTPIPSAAVSLRSLSPLFGRVWTATADASGGFAFSGVSRRPVPLGDIEIRAEHPLTHLWSPFTVVTLSTADPAAMRDVVFSNAGVVRGVVRRHTGEPVMAGSVEVWQSSLVAAVPIGAGGAYAVGGVAASASAYSLRVTLPNHPHGTPPASVPTFVTVPAGQVTESDIFIEPTGTMDATVRDAGGNPLANRTVQWQSANPSISFWRSATTDSQGRVVSTDMPVGVYVIRSAMDGGFVVTTVFTIAVDQTAPVTVQYVLPGTLTVQVLRTNGMPQPGVSVQVSGNFNAQTRTTDAGGVATFTNIPVGETANVRATYTPAGVSIPNNPIYGSGTAVLDAAQGGVGNLALTLPPFGRISGLVRKPDGTLVGEGAAITATLTLVQSGTTRLYYANASTGSAYSFDAVPAGATLTFTTAQQGRNGSLASPVAIVNDGDDLVVDTRTPAFATVRLTVQQPNGTPIVGAQVHIGGNGFYLFCSPVHPNNGVTSASGTMDFANVAEGPFEVRVYPASPALPSNYRVCYGYESPAATLEREAGIVTQADHGQVVNLTVVPQAYTVNVHGVVTLADGVTPVPNWRVQLQRAADYHSFGSVVSDANGEFAMSNLAVTGAGVVARTGSPSGAAGTVEVIETTGLADGLVEMRVVTPAYRAAVSGRVLTADGVTPASEPGEVRIVTLSGMWLQPSGQTAAGTGEFAFPSRYLPSEGFRVRFQLAGLSGGYVEQIVPPLTQNEQQVTVDLRLPASYYATIAGRVVAVGDPQFRIPGAWVELLRRDTGALVASTSAGDQGEFQVTAAVPGTGEFTVRVHSPVSSVTADVIGAVTSQAEVIDLGSIALPISVVHGVVRRSDGALLDYPSVFAILPNGDLSWAHHNGPGGSFAFFELPVGAIAVTAQDSEFGLEASVEVTVATDTSVVSADITMPPTGTVRVTVRDAGGQIINDPSLALVSDQLSSERYASNPGPGGVYVFPYVPVGGFYVQARRSVDDGTGGSYGVFASASGLLAAAGETVEVDLQFAGLGTVTVQLLDSGGNPVDGDVWIEFEAFGSSGPLGHYQRGLTRTPGDTTPWTLTDVPPGAVLAGSDDFDWTSASQSGVTDGTVRPGESLVLEIRQGTGRSFPYYSAIEIEGGLFRYSLDGEGRLGASLIDGTLWYTLGGAAALAIGGSGLDVSSIAGLSMNGRQLSIGPTALYNSPGLVGTRKVYFTPDGRYARYLDTISNPTGVPVTTTVGVSSELIGPPAPVIVEPSASTGGYATFDGVPGDNGATAYVFSGPNAPVLPDRIWYGQRTFHSQAIEFGWPITVPAGGAVSILHYVLVDLPDQLARVGTLAGSLAAGVEPGMLDGLSETELARVVNFRAPGGRLVNLRGRLLSVDGIDGVPNREVRVYQHSDSRLLATLTTPDDATGGFAVDNLAVWGPGLVLQTVGANGTALNLVVPVTADGELPVDFVTDWVYATVNGSVQTYTGGLGVQQTGGVELRRADGSVLQRLDPGEVTGGAFTFGPWYMPSSGMFLRVFMPGLPGGFVDTPVGDVTQPGAVVVDVTLPPSIVARLSGRVTGEGPRFERIEGARIILLTTDPAHAVIAETSTDRDGLFGLEVALPAAGDPLTAPFLLRIDSPTGSGVAIEPSAVATEQYQEINWLGDDEPRLPISTVAGSVSFAEGGGPVPYPTVMALGQDGITRFATISRADGTFLLYELPPGSFRLTAQDPQTGLTSSFVDPVVVDQPTSSVYDVDWELPPTETVVVRAFDEQMQRINTAVLALTAENLAFERRVGPGEVVAPNASGDYVFERVPIGNYAVQGRWTSCPGGTGCHERFASLSNELLHHVEPDFVQVEDLSFVSGGQVQVSVVFATSGPILFVLDAIGSAGPLGFWSMAFEVPGSQPSFLFENVPAGPVRATIRQDGDVGTAAGVLIQGAPEPLVVEVIKNNAAELTNVPAALDGSDGFRYPIGGDGRVTSGGRADGSIPDTLSNAGALTVNGLPISHLSAARWEMEWRELVFGPMPAPGGRGLVVTRRAFVPASGGFARYYDVVENPTAVPVTVTLGVESSVPDASTIRRLGARVDPSATTGGYAVVEPNPDGGDVGRYGASAYVFSGVDPLVSPAFAGFNFDESEVARYGWTVTIAPGASAALLHFVVQRASDDAAGAELQAAALATLGQANALDGLSAEDRARVVNFRIQ